MKFVRKASSFEEQNLVMTEEEGGLYYYTTKNVLPKEELKVSRNIFTKKIYHELFYKNVVNSKRFYCAVLNSFKNTFLYIISKILVLWLKKK